MAETLESIADLFGFGEKQPLQPPRFAKVQAVSGDTVSVIIGQSAADAVRCCGCAAGDIVLLETLPNGTLAAVATRGASGGGGGVQSVTVGTVSGATFNNSGTAENVVLDLSVSAPYELTTSGIWTVRKWADGTAECFGTITANVTSWNAWGNLYYSQPYMSASYPAGLFVAAPVEVATGQAVGDAFLAVQRNSGSASVTRTYFFARPGTAATTGQLTIDVHAFGRWQ